MHELLLYGIAQRTFCGPFFNKCTCCIRKLKISKVEITVKVFVVKVDGEFIYIFKRFKLN